MNHEETTWSDAFAVNFYRLEDNEILEIERELIYDSNLEGLTDTEIRKAVISLKRSKSFEGIKPAPYDLCLQIQKNRGKQNTFDYASARKNLESISEPVKRWEWIMENIPEGIEGANIADSLLEYCEKLPGGYVRPTMNKLPISQIGSCDKSSTNKLTENAKKKAHEKLDAMQPTDKGAGTMTTGGMDDAHR